MKVPQIKIGFFVFVVNRLIVKKKALITYAMVIILYIISLAAFPFVVRRIIDYSLNQGVAYDSTLDTAMIIVIIIAVTFVIWLEGFFSIRFSEYIVNKLQYATLRKINSIDISELEQRQEIKTVYSLDINTVEQCLTHTLWRYVRSVFLFFSSSVLLLFFSWELAFFSTLLLAVVSVIPLYFYARVRRNRKRFHLAQKRITTFFDECFNLMLVTKYHQLGSKKRVELRDIIHETRQDRSSYSYNIENASRSTFICFEFINLATLLIGFILIKNDTITVGAFVAYISVLFNLLYAVDSISVMSPIVIKASDSFERIRAVLRYSKTSRKKQTCFISGIDKFSLENVSFQYESHSALRDVTCDFPPSSLTVITGENGSGKSTLMRILSGRLQCSDGAVLINGKNIEEISQSNYISKVGYVDGENLLFNTSIYNNILLGNTAATPEMVEAIAELMLVDTFVRKLPFSYNTSVGDKGANLSLGQRQRVSLARVFLKQPELILLDEPTSAIDTIARENIHFAIRALSVNTRVICISHFLDIMELADYVIFLKEGEIEATGTHTELMRQSKSYSTLCSKLS